MLRLALAGLAVLAAASRSGADETAIDPPRGRQVEDIDKAFQAAVKSAEGAIACVLVSRSDVYRRWLGEVASADPCRLGGFDPARAVLRVPAEDQRQYDELRKSFDKANEPGAPPDRRTAVQRCFDLAEAGYVPESYGSGVVIDASGLVLTNYHVIKGATKVFVRLAGGKGSYADIQAAEPRCDLAVLRLLDRTLAPLPAIRRGDGGALHKGQLVFTLAHPFAAGMKDGSPSASWGIVSNLRRRAAPPAAAETERAKLKLHHFETLIQTDCRLNVGCSGGALLNLDGKLVGLTTALAAVAGSDVPGGFAIPMDANNRAYVARLEKGLPVEFGFLGIRFEQRQLAIAVVRGSPAERAGLRNNDVIVRVDDTPIRNNDDLSLAISTRLAGSPVRIVARSLDGGQRMVTATLDKLDVPGPVYASHRPPPFRGMRVDYTSIALQRTNSLDHIPRGVFVTEVVPGSAADAAQLHNAIILKVNGERIDGPADFRERVRSLAGPIELVILDRKDKETGTTKVRLE